MIGIKIPKMGAATVEVDLTKWHVSEGSTVSPGQIIAEVESEKTTIEIEVQHAGVIEEICIPEGASTQVGVVICRLRPT
ncbi:biotin/lipoyl-binding protein [Mesorhizobium sp. M1312]|uniref:biotin/lipoyl-containing protein n=1 Tax=unclassified Mesorhizobium TaxID=325217 RepID=UPI00333BD90B